MLPVRALSFGCRSPGRFSVYRLHADESRSRLHAGVVNHDAFAYGLKGYNDDLARRMPEAPGATGFAVSVPSRTERLPPQIRQGIRYGLALNPRATRQWIGRWADIPLDEARQLAALLGEFSHPACVSRFTGLVVHNPWVVIPIGNIDLK